ncbi:MAG TPA: hypothetical protein VGS12_04095 [Caulobacteraceae bacterium]|nr:hypothetical protein [Caulobacteraceae bacterium]
MVFAALIAVSASAQPDAAAAPDQTRSAPALAKGPAAPRTSAKTPAPKPGSPAWKYRDCLKRYKDHDGCRYLAYRKKPR